VVLLDGFTPDGVRNGGGILPPSLSLFQQSSSCSFASSYISGLSSFFLLYLK